MLVYENKVTCLYCEHHNRFYEFESINFIKANQGFCNKKKKDRLGSDEICSNFILKKGLFTNKWYPGKK